jgi:hypothetical protein
VNELIVDDVVETDILAFRYIFSYDNHIYVSGNQAYDDWNLQELIQIFVEFLRSNADGILLLTE